MQTGENGTRAELQRQRNNHARCTDRYTELSGGDTGGAMAEQHEAVRL